MIKILKSLKHYMRHVTYCRPSTMIYRHISDKLHDIHWEFLRGLSNSYNILSKSNISKQVLRNEETFSNAGEFPFTSIFQTQIPSTAYWAQDHMASREMHQRKAHHTRTFPPIRRLQNLLLHLTNIKAELVLRYLSCSWIDADRKSGIDADKISIHRILCS